VASIHFTTIDKISNRPPATHETCGLKNRRLSLVNAKSKLQAISRGVPGSPAFQAGILVVVARLAAKQACYWLENRREKCPRTPFVDNFRIADHPSGISVNLQVEYKQFIGNVRLLGSSLR